ncbi:MAG: hypothetical protein MZV63_32725 [Marinilabiliales bacterium]|nr:hypothetical protein [Marinilabiliales bacterium]
MQGIVEAAVIGRVMPKNDPLADHWYVTVYAGGEKMNSVPPPGLVRTDISPLCNNIAFLTMARS